jgi:YesN/AraC family two-component response regulator
MKFTLLIIDDEKNIREGLAANFELEDYNVKTAATGEEGLALIEKGDIDLVITDLRMPGLSGEEVLKKVTAETPRNASFTMSAKAGVKYSAPNSAYSAMASTSHMRDAPQYM